MMKQINNVNPGVKRPLRFSDIQDLWDAINQALASGTTTQVISGFELEAGNKFSRGMMAFGGQLYYHPNTAGYVINNGDNVYAKKIPSGDNRIFLDGSTQSMSYLYLLTTDPVLGVFVGVFTEANLDGWRSGVILDGSITTAKLATGAVTNSKLGGSSVTSDKIQDDAVVSTKIVDNAILARHILDGIVSTNKLSDLSVTEAKMGNLSVSTRTLIDLSVTNAKIGELSVTTSKVADLAITGAKIATATIAGNKIQNGTITGTNIAGNTITTDKFYFSNRSVQLGNTTGGSNNVLVGVGAGSYGANATTVGCDATTASPYGITVGYGANNTSVGDGSLGYNILIGALGNLTHFQGTPSVNAKFTRNIVLGNSQTYSGLNFSDFINIGNGNKLSDVNHGSTTIAGGIVIGKASTVGTGISIGNNVTNTSDASVVAGEYATATVGYANVAIGLQAFATNNATAIGYLAGADGGGIAMGNTARALAECICLGDNTNSASTAGVAVGTYSSAGDLVTDSPCVAVGRSSHAGNAGVAVGGVSNAGGTGNTGNTAIGYNAVSNAISNGTALGVYSYNILSNTVQLGSPDISTLRCQVALTVVSDERDKIDIKGMSDATAKAFVMGLKPIEYYNNPRSKYKKTDEDGNSVIPYDEDGNLVNYDIDNHEKGTRKSDRLNVGFSAQQVQKLLTDLTGGDAYGAMVLDTSISNPTISKDHSELGLSYEKMIPFLVSVIQQQQKDIDELKNRL